jgi:hypothetical protein
MAKKPTFKPNKSKFVKSSKFCDFAAGATFALGPTLDVALKTWAKFEGMFAVVFGAAACGMLLLKNLLEHKVQEEHDSPKHLDSFTRSLRPILLAAGTIRGEPELRICVYIPDGNGLLHPTDHIGFDSNELQPVERSKGVVGRAAREKGLAVCQLPKTGSPTVADFFTKVLGFDRADAMTLDQRCRSWAAVAIMNGDTLEAVLHCDSHDRDFFGNDRSIRRRILGAAVVGVVDFIRNR